MAEEKESKNTPPLIEDPFLFELVPSARRGLQNRDTAGCFCIVACDGGWCGWLCIIPFCQVGPTCYA
jgi:hypothetical protein